MKRGYVLWGAIGGIVFFSLLNLMPLFGTNNSAETAQIYGSVFSALHIIQYSDEAYSTKMDHYTQSIRNLASCHLSYGYTFIPDNGRDFGRAEGMCMYTSKVAVIRQALYEHDIGDWILWVDLDVFYSGSGCHRFEQLLRSKVGGSCEFVSLTSGHTINSGIVFIKVTPAMRAFVTDWHTRQVSVNYCIGPADQMTLQEAYLHAINSTYAGECEDGHPIVRNECFHAVAPPETRSVAGFCFFQCDDNFQTHDCDSVQSAPDDLFWHGKINTGYLSPRVKVSIWTAQLPSTAPALVEFLAVVGLLVCIYCSCFQQKSDESSERFGWAVTPTQEEIPGYSE